MIRLNDSIGYVLDVDASKVIEAVRSTGVTVTPAMMHYAHYLISNMKNIGTWQLCNAVYGFVGGTAASHKFNWKDLRDVDAAFRLIFSNVTHSSLGIITSGAADGSSYADTKLIPSTTLTVDNNHMSSYVTQNVAGTYLMGAIDDTTNQFQNLTLANRIGSIGIFGSTGAGNADRILTIASSNITGFNLGSKNGSALYQLNKQQFLTITTTQDLGSNILPTFSIWIGGLQRQIVSPNPYASANTFNFSSVGGAISTTQAIQQSQIVTNAQAILNRA